MTLRKLIKIVLTLFLLSAVVIGLTSINHPIILKWIAGAARHHGRPMQATVYTNGKVNDNIKVCYTDEPDNYLVSLEEYDSVGMLQFLNINLNESWIGRPVGTSKKDYDIIAGHLFQSETGNRFSRFQDPEKGFNFDPKLTFTDKQITFNLPPGKLKFDSVRIELP